MWRRKWCKSGGASDVLAVAVGVNCCGKMIWWWCSGNPKEHDINRLRHPCCSPHPPWGCTSHGSSVQSWAVSSPPKKIWPRFELNRPVLDSITKQEPFKSASPSVYGRSTWGTWVRWDAPSAISVEWILTDNHLGQSGNNAQNSASLIKGKMIDEPEKSGVPCFQTNLDLRLLKDLPRQLLNIPLHSSMWRLFWRCAWLTPFGLSLNLPKLGKCSVEPSTKAIELISVYGWTSCISQKPI